MPALMNETEQAVPLAHWYCWLTNITEQDRGKLTRACGGVDSPPQCPEIFTRVLQGLESSNINKARALYSSEAPGCWPVCSFSSSIALILPRGRIKAASTVNQLGLKPVTLPMASHILWTTMLT